MGPVVVSMWGIIIAKLIMLCNVVVVSMVGIFIPVDALIVRVGVVLGFWGSIRIVRLFLGWGSPVVGSKHVN